MNTLEKIVVTFLILATPCYISAAPLHPGKSDPLQLSIERVKGGASQFDQPEFQIGFRNAGQNDMVLNLGIMLSNGEVQLPDRIQLVLKEADGSEKILQFSDKRYPGISGRVDDYVVPLRAGSIYLITVNLAQFWCPDTKEFDLKFKQADRFILAQFEGSEAINLNPDMIGIKSVKFWKGKVKSNMLEVRK